MSKKQKKMLKRIIVSVILFIIALLIKNLFIKATVFLVSYLVIGYDVLIKSFKGIGKRNFLNENFLMAVATIGAIALALYEKTYDFSESCAVLIFYQIGELFQSVAVRRSRRSISELMDIRAEYATVKKDGKLIKIDPASLKKGDIFYVYPGEKVACDAVIVEGKSSLNTQALTGESLPFDVAEKDEIISGSINLTGVLKLQVKNVFEDSAVSKILDLVENATSRKSKSEAFITKFARVYTPFVVIFSLVIAFAIPLISYLFTKESSLHIWVYRALTFLVISCPCALVISIPLSFFAGIGALSKRGILVKGSNYIEILSRVKTMVFDKTGTLTKGVFEVIDIHHNTIKKGDLIEYAALSEYASNHPISKSLKRAYAKEIDISRVKDVKEIAGRGVIAEVDNKQIAVGNAKLMEYLDISYHECHDAGTIIHMAIDKKYAGHILIADVVKESTQSALQNLRRLGVNHIVMLTGDIKKAAEKIAKSLKIDSYYHSLLPQDKVEKMQEILDNKKKEDYCAFVGDGINDAPVLRLSDVGISMGSMGQDAAIEASDVVIMDDNIENLAKAVKFSKKIMLIVKENIVFCLFVKFSCLFLAFLGLADMWLAIFADVGVMVIAVINAVRLMFIKNK